MDSSDFPPGKSPRKELQGPRPAPLKIHKDSRKIRKPPVAPQASQPQAAQPPRQPLIIYDISPKIIHIHSSNFMDVVQRLTGQPSSSSTSTATTSSLLFSSTNNTAAANPNLYNSKVDFSGAISPAARYATIEKAKSPQTHSRMKNVINMIKDIGNLDHINLDDQLSSALEYDDHHINNSNKVGFLSGILSPGPASLPPIPPNFFSPLSDGFFQDLSPIFQANKNFIDASFMPSPAAAAPNSFFISPRITSPTTPSMDLLFNNIFSDNNNNNC